MKKKYAKIWMTAGLGAFLFACEQDQMSESLDDSKGVIKEIQVTDHDGRPFSTDPEGDENKFTAGPGGGVMMQAFYWMYQPVVTGGIP